ncbi:MAG: hypothetical protein AMJ95_01075 [Omnitrophica WOR_2 bacterium SM23_72]|nr:MAG: hypothetical protein AMJ95_01075 [Omnitrophica WOR_2 bacterium SM23_72]
MRKGILILIFILGIQLCCNTRFVLATDDKATIEKEAKEIVETFLQGFVNKNIDSMMQVVSVNYSEIKDGNVRDYDKFKSEFKSFMDDFYDQYIDNSFSDIHIYNLTLTDDKVFFEVEWYGKAFNLDSLQEISGQRRRAVTLVKEDGAWKIAEWRELNPSQ